MIAFLMLLATASIDPQNTEAFNIPSQYEKSTVIVLHTLSSQAEIDKACGKSPPGYTKIGCDIGRDIYLINPCMAKEEKDHSSYAHRLCHEIGHSEGWNHVNE